MPELPEVETVRRQLEAEIVGAVIEEIEVRVGKIFVGDHRLLLTDTIVKVERVGKYLILEMGSGRGIEIHLKMTGRLIMNNPTSQLSEMEYENAKHTRVVITLKGGRKVYYWDTRMFGYLKLVESFGATRDTLRAKLGGEPGEMSDSDFIRKLEKTGRAIKEVILDQRILAGVGNIYANDGLWLAGIDPRRKANTLSKKEAKKLRKSLEIVLARGLATGGASDNTYRDFYGGRGSYQDEFLVYGRGKEPCLKCGMRLSRIVVGGRGTWVCGECQK